MLAFFFAAAAAVRRILTSCFLLSTLKIVIHVSLFTDTTKRSKLPLRCMMVWSLRLTAPSQMPLLLAASHPQDWVYPFYGAKWMKTKVLSTTTLSTKSHSFSFNDHFKWNGMKIKMSLKLFISRHSTLWRRCWAPKGQRRYLTFISHILKR